MKTINYKNETIFKEIQTVQKATELQKTNFIHIIHMSLNPGDYIEMHSTPMDVSFYISHGILDMQIGDETQKVKAGTLVESPKSIPHGFKNNYESKVEILVIKHLTTK